MKKVEKYWNIGPRLIYIKCCGIGPKCQGNCGDKPEKSIIYADTHPTVKHKCRVNGCSKEKEKLCVYIVAQCTNC